MSYIVCPNFTGESRVHEYTKYRPCSTLRLIMHCAKLLAVLIVQCFKPKKMYKTK